MLDYLAKIVNGSDLKRDGYKRFIKDYLALVRPGYRDFKYRNGNQDLPEQMYHVLRCGIVHSFSLIPDSTGVNPVGRDRSIVLCHRLQCTEKGWQHLMIYTTEKISDGALFVAEDFIEDIGRAIELIFDRAQKNPTLSRNIENWLAQHPPVLGGF